MNGWIKLHRQLLDWEWYDDINVMRLFLHCLLKANFESKKWHGITVDRGEFITSLPSLSKETGLTIQQTRTALDKLKLTGEITGKQQARCRVITVVEYDQYQDDNRLDNRQTTGKQQASNRQVTATKELKKERKKETNKKIGGKLSLVLPKEINPVAFEEFEQHRKNLKKPLTDLARTKIINLLSKMTIKEQQDVIDKSIRSGWTGIFPEKTTDIQSADLYQDIFSEQESAQVYEGFCNERF